MILSSSVIQYLLYTFLICYIFDITNCENSPETISQVPTTTPTARIISTTVTPETTSTIPLTSTESPDPNPDSDDEKTTSLTSLSDEDTLVLVTNINHNETNTIQAVKSLLPIILALTIGGLVVIVLLASVLTYILVKRGYIKVFNQPRTRIKDVERTRIVDSLSTNDGSSPSRK